MLPISIIVIFWEQFLMEVSRANFSLLELLSIMNEQIANSILLSYQLLNENSTSLKAWSFEQECWINWLSPLLLFLNSLTFGQFLFPFYSERVEPQFVELLILSLSTFIISLGWSSVQVVLKCDWYIENRKTLCLVVLDSLVNLNSLSYFFVRPGCLLLATSL